MQCNKLDLFGRLQNSNSRTHMLRKAIMFRPSSYEQAILTHTIFRFKELLDKKPFGTKIFFFQKIVFFSKYVKATGINDKYYFLKYLIFFSERILQIIMRQKYDKSFVQNDNNDAKQK